MTASSPGGLAPRVLPVDEVVFKRELVWIGGFRCPVDHPLFADSGPARAHQFVFPRVRSALAGTPRPSPPRGR